MNLNATSASLLGLLVDGGEQTGGELVRVAQLRIGSFWNLTRSQVYRELQALSEAGYTAAGASGPRAARPYRATTAGTRAFRAWLAAEVPSTQVRIGLLVLVAFGRHLPAGRLAELLDAYEQEHRERLDEYRALDRHLAAEDVDPYVRATLSFGLHYETAVLSWLQALPPAVRGSTPPSGT